MFKKYTFVILALLNTIILNAQPVINAIDYPVGDELSYGYKSDTGLASAGNAGQDVLWDFSYLDAANENNYLFNNCDAYCDTFAGSNFYNTNVNANSNSYYIKNATGLYLNGFHSENNNVIVNNKFGNSHQMLMFPMQYNATFSDSFFNTFYHSYPNNIYSYSQYGTSSGIIDAYGILKTPLGTYYNVLRLKQDMVTKNESGTDSTLYTSYSWYQAGIGHSIFNAHLLAGPDNYSGYRYTTTPPNNVNAINKIQSGQHSISIYPNPAQNDFAISTNRLSNYSITVSNITGHIIYRTQQSIDTHKTKVITKDWIKGIYIIKVAEDNGDTFLGKLLVE